jgi:hypothetical protein
LTADCGEHVLTQKTVNLLHDRGMPATLMHESASR